MVKIEIQVSEKIEKYLAKNKVANEQAKKILHKLYLNNLEVYSSNLIFDKSGLYLCVIIENECDILRLLTYLCKLHIAFRLYPMEIDDIEEMYIESKTRTEVEIM